MAKLHTMPISYMEWFLPAHMMFVKEIQSNRNCCYQLAQVITDYHRVFEWWEIKTHPTSSITQQIIVEIYLNEQNESQTTGAFEIYKGRHIESVKGVIETLLKPIKRTA